jgi:hypothetical protein
MLYLGSAGPGKRPGAKEGKMLRKVAGYAEESEVEFRVLRRIMAAVESVTNSTEPEVWCGHLIARGSGMASPYVSHKSITYMFSMRPLPEYSLFAQTWRHAILIGPDIPELPAFPKRGLVTQWEGGKVPFSVVEPIFHLAREIGLRPWKPEGSLVYVWVLTPVLWGWHYAAPIYVAAKSDDENEPVEIKGEPIATQGSMIFMPATYQLSGPLPLEPWVVAKGEGLRESELCWFYNHYAVCPGSTLHPDAVLVTEKSADPVGVLYNGVRYACALIQGPAIIWARDHEPTTLPEGVFYALHPLADD